MKLSEYVWNTVLRILTPKSMVSGTNLSSKTPGLDFEDIGSLDGLFPLKS